MKIERAQQAASSLEDVYIVPEGDAVVIESLRKVRGEGWFAYVHGANYTGHINITNLQAREEL